MTPCPCSRKLIGPVAATALLHAALIAGYVAAFQGDVSALVCTSRDSIGHEPYEAITRGFGKGGYDGQFYYAIARDPLKHHEQGIDAPAARQLRILYPAVCWLLTGGDENLLLWAMPAVNLAAILALSWLGASLALRYGCSPWWGFLLPLACNVGMPALRNLTDPVATMAVFGLLAAWLSGASWCTIACWATAAVLSREQNLPILVILLVAALWTGRRSTAVTLLGVLLLWGGWVCFLHSIYGDWPFLVASGNLGMPLSGILHRWMYLQGMSGSRVIAMLQLGLVAHLTLQICLAFYLLRMRANRVIAAVTLYGVLLVVMGGSFIYETPWSSARVFVYLPMGIWLGSMEIGKRWPVLLLVPAAVWPVVAVALAWVAIH